MIDWNELTPIFFWGYTSFVTNRIIQIEYNQHDALDRYHKELIDLFQANGFKAHLDNKTVFEFHHRSKNITIYIGFYDWNFSVGLGVQGDSWIEDERKLLEKRKKVIVP